MKFYDLTVASSQKETIKMSDFKGKVVLIVNTATKCGLASQFKKLEKLHQAYKDKGLVVIGFPCNQFFEQEPETNETVVSVCKINFGVTFLLTEKIDVNGKTTHPIFKYLKKKLSSGFFGSKVKWNFTKFLITSDGKPFMRYSPTTDPKNIEKDIVKLLNV